MVYAGAGSVALGGIGPNLMQEFASGGRMEHVSV